uniref:(northern house mosquito) hypothetical protein n=1 Tax=Culex pipiens TaxID=7175 RepID=A0A8D8D9I8_CULPI
MESRRFGRFLFCTGVPLVIDWVMCSSSLRVHFLNSSSSRASAANDCRITSLNLLIKSSMVCGPLFASPRLGKIRINPSNNQSNQLLTTRGCKGKKRYFITTAGTVRGKIFSSCFQLTALTATSCTTIEAFSNAKNSEKSGKRNETPL